MPKTIAEQTRSFSYLGAFIWLIAAFFFLYEFFLRVFIGTIAGELTKSIHLNAEHLSLIGAAYFWTYGLMQLPVGILVDKYSIKKLLTMASFVCASGVLVFSYSHGFYGLLIGRLLMGLGSSFGFICLLKISLNWFSQQHFGFLSGLSQLIGALGPVLAGAPLVYLLTVTHDHWRIVMTGIGITGLFLSIMISLFVNVKKMDNVKNIIFIDKHTSSIKNLLKLFHNKQAWFIVIYSILINVSLAFLGVVWGTTYLETRHFSQSKASFICSLIWIGYAIGSPTLGFVSDKIKKRKIMLIAPALAGIICAIILLFSPINNIWLFTIIFLILGASGAGQSLAFALISEQVQPKLQATAFGLNNGGILLSSAILIPIFGFLIQATEKTKTVVYHQSDFTSSILLMLISYLLALILSSLFIRETFCRQQTEPVILIPTIFKKTNQDK